MRWRVTYSPGGYGAGLNQQQQERPSRAGDPFTAPAPIRVPKQPELSLENQVVYKHFRYLETHRNNGMSIGAIPVNAICDYARDTLELSKQQTNIFMRRVMAFDAAFLTAINEQREAEKPSTNGRSHRKG